MSHISQRGLQDCHVNICRPAHTLVRLSLPPGWSRAECRREDTSPQSPVFRPDLEVVPVSGEEAEEAEEAVWTVQHQGCGQQGRAVRASHAFFSPSRDMMTHHRKGKSLSLVTSFYSSVKAFAPFYDTMAHWYTICENNVIHLS